MNCLGGDVACSIQKLMIPHLAVNFALNTRNIWFGSLDLGSLDLGSLDIGSLDLGSLDLGSLDSGSWTLDPGSSGRGVLMVC